SRAGCCDRATPAAAQIITTNMMGTRNESRRVIDSRAVLLQEICHRLCFVKLGLLQWSATVEILCMNIRAVFYQQCGDGPLISMRSSMKRRCSPMVIVVGCINVRAMFQQHLHEPLMTFPRGAVKRRRAIAVAR